MGFASEHVKQVFKIKEFIMKRIVSILLSVIILLTLAGCGNKENENKIEHSVDVSKLAKEGRIPEVEFVIGDPVDGIKDALFEIAADMSHDDFVKNMQEAGYVPDGSEYSSYLNIIESDGRTILSASYDSANAVYCMYNTENQDAGISAIAVIGSAYGYDGNTVIDYVKNSIDEQFTEAEAKSDLSFLPKASDGATMISYEMGVYKLEFYFSSYNTLAATVLYNTETWK